MAIQDLQSAVYDLVGISGGTLQDRENTFYTKVLSGEIGIIPLSPVTWGSKPDATKYAGRTILFTDLNYCLFYSDGTNWRPCGPQDIFHRNGSVASPLVTLTGVTSGIFALPAMKIPAGLLLANSKLSIQVSGRKTGANATSVWRVSLGTTNSSSDGAITSSTSSITTLTDVIISSAAKIGPDTTKMTSQYYVGEGTTLSTGQSVQYDSSLNINTQADMYLNFGIQSASASDSFSVYNIRITYEV